ncbi:Elongation factor 1-alpha [Phytophthora megakarya]|uniref:Elongation factor 1-alpha n=1 Tax=Phytophthora megakarya TaxID=4795 RepID=A0A225WI13_9STRA|nr:Elongation factor 1-alpha [Phytophthora megakarya]
MLQVDASTVTQLPAIKVHTDSECGDKPSFVVFLPGESCDDYTLDECMSDDSDNTTSFSVSCTNNYRTLTDTVFGNTSYLITELYEDGTECGTLVSVVVYTLDGKCHGFSGVGSQVTLNANNSITVIQDTDGTCTELDYSTLDTIPSDMINSGECFEHSVVVYTNEGANTTTTSTTTGDAKSFAMTSFVTPMLAILVSVVVQTIFAL